MPDIILQVVDDAMTLASAVQTIILPTTTLVGPTGPQGSGGKAATIVVNATTTLPPGSSASVVNVGTSNAAVLNFGIPGPSGQPVFTSVAAGFVPPSGGGTAKFLRADATFATPPNTAYSLASPSAAGLIAALPPSAGPTYVAQGDNTWTPIAGLNVAYSSLTGVPTMFVPSSHASSHTTGSDVISAPTLSAPGLAPALPSSNQTVQFLRGDGAYARVVQTPATLSITTEIWVSLRTDGNAGTGTLADPFDASTVLKFDAIMNAIGQYTTVHLSPGVFLTNGGTFNGPRTDGKGFVLHDGVKIIGAGMGTTVLRLNSIDPGDPSTIIVSTGGASGGEAAREVRNITLDCNYSGLTVPTGNALNHIYIECDHAKVIGVEFINSYGLFPNTESFSCQISGSNSIVDSCYFHSYHGDYTNGPLIGTGSNCFITNCSVEGAGHAYGFSDANGGVLSHCSSDILTDVAYFIDTGTNSHISIINNVLRAKTNPIEFNVAVDHILIANNYIECNNSTGATNMAIGLHPNSDSMRIANNIYVDSGNQTTGFIKWGGPLSNITVEGNISNVAAFPSGAADWRLTPGVFSGTNVFGTLDPLSYTRLKDKLTTFTSSAAGIVPASGGGTVKYLRADGTFATPPSAGLATTSSIGLVAALPSSNPTLQFLRGDNTFSPIVPSPSALAITSEIWVSLRTDGLAGTGTIANPFDASTVLKFDALIHSVANGTTIHLGPGVFLTDGSNTGFGRSDGKGCILPNGCKLIGAGIGITTLRLNSIVAGQTQPTVIASFGGANSPYCEVREMTVDGNYSNLTLPSGFCIHGVALNGDNSKIVNVEMINSYGVQVTNSESFAISTSGNNTLIEGCYAHSFHGDYTNGPVAGTGNNCVINACHVEGANHGYGFSGCDGGALTNSSTDIATTIGYYVDTGTSYHISIKGNAIRANTIPIQYNTPPGNAKGIIIEGNYLESSNATGSANAGIQLSLADQVRIANNVYVDSGNQTTGFLLYFGDSTHVTVEGNHSNVAAFPAGALDWRNLFFQGNNIFGSIDPLSFLSLKDIPTASNATALALVPTAPANFPQNTVLNGQNQFVAPFLYPYNRTQIIDDFHNGLSTIWTETIANSAPVAVKNDATALALGNADGTITLSTGIIATGSDTIFVPKDFSIASLGSLTVAFRYRLRQLSTSTQRFTLQFGLSDNPTGTPTNAAYVQYVDNVNSGHWEIVRFSGGTAQTIVAGDLSGNAPSTAAWSVMTVFYDGANIQATVAGQFIIGGEAPAFTGPVGPFCRLAKSVGTTACLLDLDLFVQDQTFLVSRIP